ncbi:MAG: lysine--tRNA ligase, partial [Candidatus Paceibacteria bacterium]
MALDEIRKTKIEKIKKLRKAGIESYPAVSERTHSISEALLNFDDLSNSGKETILAGRVMAKREHGGSVFFDINDGSGKIQGLIKEDVVGKNEFNHFGEFIDRGDFVEVKGTLLKTKTGEKTLLAASYRLLSKALLPLPEKWHGLEDTEERLRKRYLDLVMHPEEKEIFIKKARFWQATREFLMKEGGLEVETPVLEQIPGGADAEPFKTHMNALDIDLYLRIAPELHLKRLIVAGFEKVFEIGKAFRNEDIDAQHNPEYTLLELYWAYVDYNDIMTLTENLIHDITLKILGKEVIEYQGKTIDLRVPWRRLSFLDALKEYGNIDID